MNNNEPLAYRMRPKTLEEYVGQEHGRPTTIKIDKDFIKNKLSIK